jgi:hypothetical protein
MKLKTNRWVRTLGFVLPSLAVCAFNLAIGQEKSPSKEESKMNSPIRLLPGYKVQAQPGIDTGGGRFWKEGGLDIHFSIGMLVFRYADSIPANQVQWRVEQIVNGNHVTCVFTKSEEFIVTVNEAPVSNFDAKITSQQELAEMLLMVLTYDIQHPYPVDPKYVVPRPQRKY